MMTKQCPKCKKEVPVNAKTCEFCNADLRDWIYKHKILTGVAIFIVLVIIANTGNSTKDSTFSNQKNISQSASNTNTTAENKAEEVNKLPGVNEEAIVDTLKIKVLKVSNLGQKISQPYLGPITTQGKFIRIDFEVENTGKEAEYMGTMEIIDSESRVFSESDKKFTILSTEANFLDKFNPNVKTKYSTVFDVAVDAKKLTLKVGGFGLFNSNSTMIDLGVDA